MKAKITALLLPFLTLIGINVSGQYKNIMISDYFMPEEVSIAVSLKNPALVVAGANITNYYYSADSGKTWEHGFLKSTYGVGGDPMITTDTAGDFYYFHLSEYARGERLDRIVCQKSTDGGKTWSKGTFMGLNGSKVEDKHWAVVDPATNFIYVTWTQFDKYKDDNPGPADSSNIMFSSSFDNGRTWTPALRINKYAGDCMDSDSTVEGAVPAVGPDGEVYVSWAGPKGLVFNRSTDRGKTWLQEEIKVSDFPGGWDFDIPGIYRCNGMPVTVCDLSKGANRGTIYINWADQRNGKDNTDIWLSKSTDRGNTWSKPVKVNNDNKKRQQFLTWMAIDRSTGYLYIVFYDRRKYSAKSLKTDVYLAISKDGGMTFRNIKISEKPFAPDIGVFFGDYNNISVVNGIVRPIWTRLENSGLSVWTALINMAE